ncbi:hypothetical protein G7054_g11381 [Neopestalotiopsis clavispora]|nr:hypothetical protein G7054_g11381 [Neopestalotiopsis clavispora]
MHKIIALALAVAIATANPVHHHKTPTVPRPPIRNCPDICVETSDDCGQKWGGCFDYCLSPWPTFMPPTVCTITSEGVTTTGQGFDQMSIGMSTYKLTAADIPPFPSPRFGLRQVYPDPEEDDSDKNIDIIAIHGLETQPRRRWSTWEQDGDPSSGEVHWLKDAHMLPQKIPNARIFTYDWNTNIERDAATDGLLAFADGFLEALHIEKFEDSKKRPILFVASSFGGLLLIRALHRASERESKYHHILQSTAGVIFLGTPFQGSDETFRTAAQQRAIVAAMTNKQGSDDLVSYLQQDHKIDELVQVFLETAKQPQFSFPITCFYETLESNFQGLRWKLPPDLASKLEKDSGVLVDRHSATLPGEKALPLNVRHSMLCKFATPTDQAFQSVSFHLWNLVRNAREVLNKKQVPFDFMKSVKKSHFVVPFGRNEDFVGRESFLNELLKKIPPGAKRQDCQRTAIEGLGGVGKTQIALEAAYRFHDQYPECSVFWAPAVNVTTFVNAYRDIGRRLGVRGIEDDNADVKTLVKQALGQDHCGSWLLIVDNIDDVDLLPPAAGSSIRDYLPYNSNGSILFTTRNHGVVAELDIRAENVHRIEEMSKPEAMRLLVTNLKPHQAYDVDSTERLTEHLAFLPLAIKQASMYMYRTGVSTAEYLRHCMSSDQAKTRLLSQDFEDRNRYRETHNPIATTWLISFEHITQSYPLAAQYLKFISFLAEKDIPRSILPRGEDDITQDEAVAALCNYAFISLRRDGADSFDIHRLVRQATRNWLKNEHELLQEVTDHLAEIYPSPKEQNRNVWTAYLPHAKAVLSLNQDSIMEGGHVRLLVNVAESLTMMSKYKEAEQMHRQALEIRKQVRGPESPDTLTSMHSLALVIASQGRYQEAEQMHRHILQVREETLGPTDTETLTSMDNLANVLVSLKGFNEAKHIYWKTCGIRQRFLGSEHPDTLRNKNNLALVYEHQERYQLAESLLRDAVSARSMKVLGQRNSETLVSMNNLMRVLWKMEKYDEAQTMYRQISELKKEVLGSGTPDTFQDLNRIASVPVFQGKNEESDALSSSDTPPSGNWTTPQGDPSRATPTRMPQPTAENSLEWKDPGPTHVIDESNRNQYKAIETERDDNEHGSSRRSQEYVLEGESIQEGFSSLDHKNLRTTSPEAAVEIPMSIGEALETAKSEVVEQLLTEHFNQITQGGYEWLHELKDIGYSFADIADLLLAQKSDSPWIYFNTDTAQVDEFQCGKHIQGCAHEATRRYGNTTRISAGELPEGPTKDLLSPGNYNESRIAVQKLCGLAGIIPVSRDKKSWNGLVEFSDNNMTACISYPAIVESYSLTVSLLSRVLDGLCAAVSSFQSHGFCCDSFTILVLPHNVHPTTEQTPLVECCRVDFATLRMLRNCLAASKAEDSHALGFPSFGILTAVFRPGQQQIEDLQRSGHLTLLSLTVQFLCLGFLSYSQAHIGSIHPFFLETPIYKARLLGVSAGAGHPFIEGRLVELTCMAEMVRKPVFAFSLGFLQSTSEGQDLPQLYDLRTSFENIVDTWGPGHFVVPSEKDNRLPVALVIGGGTIHATDLTSNCTKFHWSKGFENLEIPQREINPQANITIGTPVCVNTACRIDHEQCRQRSAVFLEQLGVYPPHWELKEQQAGLQAGQYVLVEISAARQKVPGRTLKDHILQLTNMRELVSCLNDPIGLQVSVCTGVSRRVPLRELVADLLPVFADTIAHADTDTWQQLQGRDFIEECRSDTIQQYFRQLPDKLQTFALEQIRRILKLLADTGIDPSGQHMIVAWPRATELYRCFRVRCENESAWTKILTDTEACATFAYITTRCFQAGNRFNCQTRWRNAIPPLETAVRHHEDGSNLQHNAKHFFQITNERLVVTVHRHNATAMAELVGSGRVGLLVVARLNGDSRCQVLDRNHCCVSRRFFSPQKSPYGTRS